MQNGKGILTSVDNIYDNAHERFKILRLEKPTLYYQLYVACAMKMRKALIVPFIKDLRTWLNNYHKEKPNAKDIVLHEGAYLLMEINYYSCGKEAWFGTGFKYFSSVLRPTWQEVTNTYFDEVVGVTDE